MRRKPSLTSVDITARVTEATPHLRGWTPPIAQDREPRDGNHLGHRHPGPSNTPGHADLVFWTLLCFKSFLMRYSISIQCFPSIHIPPKQTKTKNETQDSQSRRHGSLLAQPPAPVLSERESHQAALSLGAALPTPPESLHPCPPVVLSCGPASHEATPTTLRKQCLLDCRSGGTRPFPDRSRTRGEKPNFSN